jgi:hypothetical protein
MSNMQKRTRKENRKLRLKRLPTPAVSAFALVRKAPCIAKRVAREVSR